MEERASEDSMAILSQFRPGQRQGLMPTPGPFSGNELMCLVFMICSIYYFIVFVFSSMVFYKNDGCLQGERGLDSGKVVKLVKPETPVF